MPGLLICAIPSLQQAVVSDFSSLTDAIMKKTKDTAMPGKTSSGESIQIEQRTESTATMLPRMDSDTSASILDEGSDNKGFLSEEAVEANGHKPEEDGTKSVKTVAEVHEAPLFTT